MRSFLSINCNSFTNRLPNKIRSICNKYTWVFTKWAVLFINEANVLINEAASFITIWLIYKWVLTFINGYYHNNDFFSFHSYVEM